MSGIEFGSLPGGRPRSAGRSLVASLARWENWPASGPPTAALGVARWLRAGMPARCRVIWSVG